MLKLGSQGAKDPGGHFATFAGFAPATNPRLAAIVVLDDAATVYGGSAAAPAWSQIMGTALLRMQVPAPKAMKGVPHQYDQAKVWAAQGRSPLLGPVVPAGDGRARRSRLRRRAPHHDDDLDHHGTEEDEAEGRGHARSHDVGAACSQTRVHHDHTAHNGGHHHHGFLETRRQGPGTVTSTTPARLRLAPRGAYPLPVC